MDQLNGTLSLDRRTHDALRALAPHMSTFDLNAPRKVSKNLAIPGPVVSTISSWMHHSDAAAVDPEKAARMAQLPDAV